MKLLLLIASCALASSPHCLPLTGLLVAPRGARQFRKWLVRCSGTPERRDDGREAEGGK